MIDICKSISVLHFSTSILNGFNSLVASIITPSFIEKLSIDNNLFRIINPFILLLLFLLVFKFTKITQLLYPEFIKKNSAKDSKSEEYQLYFLLIGLLIPFLEITFEIFKIRNSSLLFVNCLIGILFLSIYWLSKKSNWLYKQLETVFRCGYILALLHIGRNIILFSPDTIPLIAFVTAFFFSYSIIRVQKYYWLLVASIFVFLFVLIFFELVPINTSILLFNYCIVVVVVNYIRQLSTLNLKNKLNFNNQIINKGNSLILATNTKAEVVFCSENIEAILGYAVEHVMGQGYWQLTEDPEFSKERYYETFYDDKVFIRKLKCKNGEHKYIQWINKRFSNDLIIGIGQDVTHEIQIKNQYENLIQNAIDLIYEVDYKGNFIFINDFTLKELGYKKEKMIGNHFANFVRPDYVPIMEGYYQNINPQVDYFPTIEIPILKKNGQEIWVSQKVIIRKDESNRIMSYSGIARDITKLKEIEAADKKRQRKLEEYNKTITKLNTTNFSKYVDLELGIKQIIETVARVTKCNRVSYWKFIDNAIICESLYELDINQFSKGQILQKSDYPIYLEEITSRKQLRAPNVFKKKSLREFTKTYFVEQDIKSVLDVPLIINGDLVAVLCLEATKTKIKWDNEDLNFVKSIVDIIALTIISQSRYKTEAKLAYKSELLSAMALCTENFLNSSDIKDIFADALVIMGKATKSHRSYFYENNSSTELISQKYKWFIHDSHLSDTNPKLQNLPYAEFEELLTPLLNNEIYEATISTISNPSLRKKLEDVEVKSLILFPIFVKDTFKGFLGFDDTITERYWSEDEVTILRTLARNIASSIERITNEIAINESEEKFRLLANNIPGTVYLSNFDEDNTKIYINDEIEKLTGYPKNAFLNNELSFIDLIHPEDREKAINDQKKAISKKKIYSSHLSNYS